MRANPIPRKRLGETGCGAALAALSLLCAWGQNPQPAGRVIEVLADHDSRYKLPGQKQPILTVKAGEPITLRIMRETGARLTGGTSC